MTVRSVLNAHSLRLLACPLKGLFHFSLVALFATIVGLSGEFSLANEPGEKPTTVEPIEDAPVSADDSPLTQLEPEGPVVAWDPQAVADFSLVDQLGRKVTKADLLGKTCLVSFIFTRCVTDCRTLCKQLMDFKKQLGNSTDVRFVSITVDPAYDTVEVLKNYSENWSADPESWLFLTGDKEDVYRLIRQGFKVTAWENVGSAVKPGFEFAHSLSLVYIGADGKILGRFGSTESDLAILAKVLQGKREVPPDNRPVPPHAVIDPPRPQSAPPVPIASNPFLGKAEEKVVPDWVLRLPKTNALLNGLAALLLVTGLMAVKAGQVNLHKKMMLFAFAVSILFLGCYVTYHVALSHYTGDSSKKFTGVGPIRAVYFALLISHVILAMTVPVLASMTIYRAWKQNWEGHKRIAKITLPIWLYVSVTGVIIYLMLYGA